MGFARKNTINFFICTKIVLIVYSAIGILRQNFHLLFQKDIGESFEYNFYFIKGDHYPHPATQQD